MRRTTFARAVALSAVTALALSGCGGTATTTAGTTGAFVPPPL